MRQPITAVNQDGQSATVMVINGGSVFRRSISIGLTEPNYVEIPSGLSTDDIVVDPFDPELKDRQMVSYTEATSVASGPDRIDGSP